MIRFLRAGAASFLLAAPAVFAGGTADVEIVNFQFVPAQLKVSPGTTVRWSNREKRASHSIFFSGPQGFESERLFPDESYSRRFDTPGRYPYSCGPHPEMSGVVEVVE